MDQKRAEMQTKEAKVRGIAAMSSYMSDVAARNAWTDPNARAGFYALGAKHPDAIDDPTLQAMGQLFETAQARKAQAEQHAQTPAISELNEADLSGNKAKVLEEFAATLGAGKPGFDEASAEARRLRERELILKGKQTPTGETIESFGPGGEIISRITRGGAGKAPESPGALTVATRTKRQADLSGYADFAETLAYINKNKNASDFGVAGQFKEAYARIAGQLGMEVPKGTVSTRAAVTTLRAALVKALRSDSNIAEAERKVLEKSIPSTSDITESFATATDKLNEAARNIFGRSRRAAEELGVPVPAWLIKPDELREQFRNGRYGDPTSQAAKDNFIRDLRTYHGFD